jgi:DNA-directed RNA polymerase specialized sigma24 family protein
LRSKVQPAAAGGAGVSLDQLRAAVELSRDPAAEGAAWSFKVWAALWVTLTPPQQRVVYLVALVGLTHDEAAADLNSTRAAVTMTWRRACVRLRDLVPVDA